VKIGNYNRAIKDFATLYGIEITDMKVLLALSDVMWMGFAEMRHAVVLAPRTVKEGFYRLVDYKLIKVARAENSFKKLCRKYTITQKGRELASEFINTLN